jgi:hypothetical protein
MRPATIVALVLAVVFGALAALHVYWAARGTAGAGDSATVPTRADGTPLFRPGPLPTLAVAAALGVAALVVLGRSGAIVPMAPWWIYRMGAWMLGIVLLLRAIGDFRYVGFFKRERHGRFAVLDTRYYTPLCAALAAGVIYLAAG